MLCIFWGTKILYPKWNELCRTGGLWLHVQCNIFPIFVTLSIGFRASGHPSRAWAQSRARAQAGPGSEAGHARARQGHAAQTGPARLQPARPGQSHAKTGHAQAKAKPGQSEQARPGQGQAKARPSPDTATQTHFPEARRQAHGETRILVTF